MIVRQHAQLVSTIETFIENDNKTARPFVWVANADSIFAQLDR